MALGLTTMIANVLSAWTARLGLGRESALGWLDALYALLFVGSVWGVSWWLKRHVLGNPRGEG